jgi:radical SAM superfamily enzyme YgiQ (UPF0313 family)
LLEIATYLKYNGFENVGIIDGEIEKIPFKELLEKVINIQPAIALIQATTPTINDDLVFASLIKKGTTKTKIIISGLHGTVFADSLLNRPFIDYVVLGEPEETIPELLDFVLEGQGDISNLKGVAYRLGGSIFVNERRPQRGSYDYPVLPDRSLLKNHDYIMPLTGKPFSVIKVSRGCDYACSFCTSSVYYGRGWRGRSPANIIEEIKDVKINYGIDNFLFLADTFNANQEFVDSLCSMIVDEKLGINWVSNCRPDLVQEESVRLMSKAGCMLVSLGIESHDAEVLKANKKNLTSGSVEKCLKIFNKYGILTYGYYIFGLEKENKKTALRTIFRSSKSDLDFAAFYSLTPYPGTEYFRRYNNLDWKEYFHGKSNIVGYGYLGKRTIKLAIFFAYIFFYAHPKRIKKIFEIIIKKNVSKLFLKVRAG